MYELDMTLPNFSELLALLPDASTPTPRLKAAIQAFYGDLFDFFREVVMVFVKKSGS